MKISYLNQRILITGSTRGIGKSLSELFLQSGADVILTGTNNDEVNELNENNDNPNKRYLQLDFNSEPSIETFLDKIGNIGKIDVLINNAGINKDALSIRMTKEQWDEVININLTAAFKLSQLAIKSMLKQKWGRIIGISSIIGIGGNIGQSNYASSKAGMIALHKSLALEFATRGITINCIAPGFIESPMTEALTDEQKEIMLKKIPVGKVGKPDDIANCVEFLTGENASFITGSTVNINGGMLMV